jgi:hypothetical protein
MGAQPLKLAKSRSCERELAFSLAGGHMPEGTDKEEPYPYRHFGYREIGRRSRELRLTNSRDHASCDKDFGLGPWS